MDIWRGFQVHHEMFADVYPFDENPAHAHVTSVNLSVISQTGGCISNLNNARNLCIESV